MRHLNSGKVELRLRKYITSLQDLILTLPLIPYQTVNIETLFRNEIASPGARNDS